VLKALTVVGSIGGTGHFEEVIDFIDHNRECVGALVSHRFRFSDTDSLKKGFEAAANSKSSVKVQFEV
jgi:threonine dehydrogenase-like Zn-dependent dehydrogenase